MKSLSKIIWKNLKLLARSKSSLIIFILGPLLTIFLAGFAFNSTGIYRINVAAYSTEYTELTNIVLGSLEENNLNIKKYTTDFDCIEAVKQGSASVCVIFNGDLKVGPDMDNELNLYVDYSKVNLAYMVLEMVSAGLEKTSSNLTMGMTTNILEKLFFTQEELNKDKEIVKSVIKSVGVQEGKADSINADLAGLDLAMDLDEFKTSDIKSISSDLQKKADVLSDEMVSALDSIESKLDRLNVTDDEKESLYVKINQTRNRAELIAGQVGGRDEDMREIVAGLEDGLSSIKNKLLAAGSAREDIKSEVQGLLSLFESDVEELKKLSSSFDRITSRIAGIEVTDADDIAKPIVTNLRPITVNRTHLFNIFPSLILVVIMFVAILLSSTLVMMEKSSRAYVRNFITPTKDITFVLATYFTSLFVVALQIAIILGISFFVFKFLVAQGFATAMLAFFLAATVFILIGMLIGYLFKSEEASTLTSIFFSSLFIFMSGLILPLESMPDSVLQLGLLNPFVISETILRQSIFFGYGPGELTSQIVLLVTYILVLFGSIMTLQKIQKKMLLTKRNKEPGCKK